MKHIFLGYYKQKAGEIRKTLDQSLAMNRLREAYRQNPFRFSPAEEKKVFRLTVGKIKISDRFDAKGIKVVRRGINWMTVAGFKSGHRHISGETTWRNGRVVGYSRAENTTFVESWGRISADGRSMSGVQDGHPINMTLPDGFRFGVENENLVVLRGSMSREYSLGVDVCQLYTSHLRGVLAGKKNKMPRPNPKLGHSTTKKWLAKFDIGIKFPKGGVGQILLIDLKNKRENYHCDSIRQVLGGRQALLLRRSQSRKKIRDEKILKHANRIFVSLDDSIRSGNCPSGTAGFGKELCDRIKAVGNEIPAFRGDFILSVRNDEYTRRAVVAAGLRYNFK